MNQPFKMNLLESGKLMGPMVDKHWEGVRWAHEQGKKVAWVFGPSISELAIGAGMATHFYAGYASYCGGRGAVQPILDAAGADGYLPDACSYIRLHMGLVSMDSQGQQHPHEDMRVPMPDLILCARLCPEQGQVAQLVSRQLKVPTVIVDFPTPRREEDMASAVNYYERQLKEEAIPVIESVLERPYDYARLSQILDSVKKCAILRNQCLGLARNVPSPWTFFDMCISMAPMIYLAGQPGTLEYYQKLKAELEYRVANKIPAILPEEKYRLYWDHMLMWGWVGPIARTITGYGANPMYGRYAHQVSSGPELINPEDPVRSLAERFVRDVTTYETPEFMVTHLARWVKDFSIDGLIMVASRTCRLYDLGQLVAMKEIKRRFGTPGVALEADLIDPQFQSMEEVKTKVEDLLEFIDKRR